MKIPAIPIVIVSPYQILAPPMAAKICQSAKLCTTHLLLLVELIPEPGEPHLPGWIAIWVASYSHAGYSEIPWRIHQEMTWCSSTEGLKGHQVSDLRRSFGMKRSLGLSLSDSWDLVEPQQKKTLALASRHGEPKKTTHPPTNSQHEATKQRTAPPALLRTPASELGPLDQH